MDARKWTSPTLETMAPESRRENAGSIALSRIFSQDGTLIRLIKHQQVALTSESADHCYLVRQGTLALEAAMPERHIVGFGYAGDLVETRCLPNLPSLALRAVEATELWRIRKRSSTPLFADQPEAFRAYQRLSLAMLKRLVVTNAMLGRLTGEQRLASFLVLHVARLGQVAANRTLVEIPMSRADIADHLSLNPDTLSRLVTVLQNDGLIETQGRQRLLIRDWQGLRARTPLAEAILDAT
jgi:CRP-like cAMP-binding protein